MPEAPPEPLPMPGYQAERLSDLNGGTPATIPGDSPQGTKQAMATAATPVISSLVASPALPKPYGTPITWTASASGGTAPLQYQFWRLDGGVWNIVKPYSTSNTFSWTPAATDVGQHDVSVWVRSAGSVAPWDAWKDTGLFNITALATVTNIVASPTLPKPAGTSITFTATATGPAGLQYRFYRLDGTAWVLVRDWAVGNTYTWATVQGDIGTHNISVWVKTPTTVAAYESYRLFGNFLIQGPATITSLVSSPVLPRAVNTAITFTCNATGIPGPLEYKFLRLDAGIWNLVRDYTTTKTWAWTPTAAQIGQHSLACWTRTVGTTVAWQDWRVLGPFQITGSTTIQSLVASPLLTPILPPAGQPISFTANATGTPGPLEYQFFRNDGSGFNIVQPWSASKVYSWIPSPGDTSGTHDVSVYVRNLGSLINYEAWKETGYFGIAAPQPLVLSALTSAPAMPRPHGSIILWKAKTAGGLAPLTYQFWKYNYATASWAIAQPWSTNDTFTWTPAPGEVGDYTMSVWVRNAGSVAPYDTYVQVPKFTVTPPTTDIARFLEQATFGPSDGTIELVRQMGMSAWIDAQFNTAPSGFPPFNPVMDQAPASCTGTCQRDNYSIYPIQRQFYLNALYGQDQLRQRVAFALHSLVVSSGFDLPLPSWYQPYLDIINRNAFGNYRQLLYEITLNPGMGIYLDLSSSTKNNPNENYAREILQLFATGTDQLNLDGTPQTLANGDIIPVYDQFQVDEFARVFTGWRFATPIGAGITNYRDPMVPVSANHDLNPKFLLGGFTTGAGASPAQDMNDAIDNIFNHPNVGPYVAKNLIQSLVTSNPTPAYVARVATK
ncbi:MAG: DUF1800 family protein, partial [Actinomycetota bacterium]